MNGRVKVDSREIAENIAKNLQKNQHHSLKFRDIKTNKNVSGGINAVGQDTSAGINILRIEGSKLDISY